MQFEDFIGQGKVVVCEKDFQKARALVKMSDNNLTVISRLEIDPNSSQIILGSVYESLRQILEAICLSQGYKVYSHEAFTFFLKKLKEDSIAEAFDRLRKLRNGINYYGKMVSTQTASEAKSSVKRLTKLLKEEYLFKE